MPCTGLFLLPSLMAIVPFCCCRRAIVLIDAGSSRAQIKFSVRNYDAGQVIANEIEVRLRASCCILLICHTVACLCPTPFCCTKPLTCLAMNIRAGRDGVVSGIRIWHISRCRQWLKWWRNNVPGCITAFWTCCNVEFSLSRFFFCVCRSSSKTKRPRTQVLVRVRVCTLVIDFLINNHAHRFVQARGLK